MQQPAAPAHEVNAPGATMFTLRGDVSAIEAAFAELRATLQAVELVTKLRSLALDLGGEFVIANDAPAVCAGDIILRLQLKPGGRLERCLAAVRALRLDVAGGSGHAP